MVHPVPETALRAAARILARGGLVAFPTETVYGLGADATNGEAVARIFAAKERPRFNPLIVHLSGAAEAAPLVAWDERAAALADAFWPGPLTLVLPRREDTPLAPLVSAGRPTAAVRVPGHTVARRLIHEAGVPVAAPSANRAGTVSPTTAGHVRRGLGSAVDAVLDGGPCTVGVESTVLDLTGGRPVILRPGGVTAEALADVIGPVDTAPAGADDAPDSPGRLTSHYAPATPVRLNAASAGPGEVLLAFGPGYPGADANLSPSGDLVAAAASLFACLHALDRPDVAGIAVTPIPEEGLGAAINDRLQRAAAERG